MNLLTKILILFLFIGIGILYIKISIGSTRQSTKKNISRRKPSYLQNKKYELNVHTKIYEPSFISLLKTDSLLTDSAKGYVQFSLLNNTNKQTSSVISKQKYKNIAYLTFSVDLTKISNLNYINTSIDLINQELDKKFTIIETTGNKIFQTSNGSNNYKSSKYNKWNFSLINLVNVIDPINNPFDIKVNFVYGEDPKMQIFAIQNDEIGLINEEEFSLPEITQLMSQGFKIMLSFSQKYIPTNKNHNQTIDFWEINNMKIKAQIA